MHYCRQYKKRTSSQRVIQLVTVSLSDWIEPSLHHTLTHLYYSGSLTIKSRHPLVLLEFSYFKHEASTLFTCSTIKIAPRRAPLKFFKTKISRIPMKVYQALHELITLITTRAPRKMVRQSRKASISKQWRFKNFQIQ
jgi:hypothetical protein